MTTGGAYPIPFNGQPLFLVDARLHPGTSGNPSYAATYGLNHFRVLLVNAVSLTKPDPGNGKTLQWTCGTRKSRLSFPLLLPAIHFTVQEFQCQATIPLCAPIASTISE